VPRSLRRTFFHVLITSTMSFFGFDPTLPRDRGHPTKAPGFGQAPDPFATLSKTRAEYGDDDDDGYASYAKYKYMDFQLIV
jgi:hypothetical protein